MKKDKITNELTAAIKKIEANEVTFTKRRKKLIEKYIELYTSPDITSSDLIERKNYILHWRNNFFTVYLGLVLSAFVSTIFNMFGIVQVSDNPIVKIWVNCIGLIVVVSLSIWLSTKFSNILTNTNDVQIRYNTMEFEVKLIDEILEKECPLSSVKQKIIDTRCIHIVKIIKKRCPCVLSCCKNEHQK